MSRQPFKTIEHTADIGLEASGKSFSESFANLGLGMFSIMTDLEKIDPKECQQINISSVDSESLTVEWLNELLFLFQAKGLLLNKFDITEADETSIKAVCCGEKYDENKHPLKIEIKAVTYYELSVSKTDGINIRVTFDI